MGGLENAEDALNLRPDIELFQARTVLFNTQIWIDPTRFYKVIELKRVFLPIGLSTSMLVLSFLFYTPQRPAKMLNGNKRHVE